jgi:group I intron endonuclease
MTCGIYKITNKQNEKFYIGSSVDVEQRWYTHKSYLRRNVHVNQHLQNAWNKHGEDNFIFSILVETDEDALLDKEQEFIDETNCCDREVGYNKALFAGSPMKGRKHYPETIEKLRKISASRVNSPETRRKISLANKGSVFSAETRKRMSDAKKGIAPATSFLPPSPEGRKRISEYAKTRTGHKNPNSRLTPEQIHGMRKDFEEGELTNGKIAEKYGVSISTVKRIKYGKSGY